MVKATSVKDVDQSEVVLKIAHFLKKSGKVKVPEWADLVKTGIAKELAPVNPDWYYIRAASLARRLYIRSPAGIGAFKNVYGGKLRRGVQPNGYALASGSIIRKALQTLEALKWVEKHPENKGRILSRQGRKDLDRIAGELRQEVKPVEYN